MSWVVDREAVKWPVPPLSDESSFCNMSSDIRRQVMKDYTMT